MSIALWKTYSLDEIKQMVAETRGFNELSKRMGYKGNTSYTNNQLRKYFDENDIDYSHYNGQAWRAGGQLTNLGQNDFGVITPSIIKKHLLQEREHKCECCQQTEWLGQKIMLEVHHIDGDRTNNTRENLMLLCPNCHSMTENWCGKNKNTRQVTDEDIIAASKISKSICEICTRVGWNADANHYAKVKEVLSK